VDTQQQDSLKERQTVALEGIAWVLKAMFVLGLVAAAMWFVIFLVA
jgi:hypothetical protein